jgi:hypothetical protein
LVHEVMERDASLLDTPPTSKPTYYLL